MTSSKMIQRLPVKHNDTESNKYLAKYTILYINSRGIT